MSAQGFRRRLSAAEKAAEKAAAEEFLTTENEWMGTSLPEGSDLARQHGEMVAYFWARVDSLPRIFAFRNDHIIGMLARLVYMANHDPALDALLYPFIFTLLDQGWPLGRMMTDEGWWEVAPTGAEGSRRLRLSDRLFKSIRGKEAKCPAATGCNRCNGEKRERRGRRD